MRKRWLPMSIVLAAVALAGAGALAWTVARPERSPPERLVVASLRQPATSLLFLAQGAGCFDAAGIAVEERPFEVGRDGMTLLRNDGADVAIAFQTPVLRGAFQDPRLRVLSTLHVANENMRVVARRDHGIAAPADLRGRRVGVTRGTSAEFFVATFLQFAGVPAASVRFASLEPAAIVDGLVRGELDAAALFDPHAGRVEAQLGSVAVSLTSDVYLEASLVATREDVVASRRPALERFLRGLVCAERFARARPVEAFSIVHSRFPELSETELRGQLDRVRWSVGLDNLLLSILVRERDWLGAQGVPGSTPDVSRLVEAGPLEAVAPDAVLLLPGA